MTDRPNYFDGSLTRWILNKIIAYSMNYELLIILSIRNFHTWKVELWEAWQCPSLFEVLSSLTLVLTASVWPNQDADQRVQRYGSDRLVALPDAGLPVTVPLFVEHGVHPFSHTTFNRTVLVSVYVQGPALAIIYLFGGPTALDKRRSLQFAIVFKDQTVLMPEADLAVSKSRCISSIIFRRLKVLETEPGVL